jgi:hypothetical protein
MIAGTAMANDVDIPKPDRAVNRATYESFMGVTKTALILIIGLLILLAIIFV